MTQKSHVKKKEGEKKNSSFFLSLCWPPQGILDELSLPLGREDFSKCLTGTVIDDCWHTNII